MERYFNTEESAKKHLEIRRKAAYKRIEKRGEKVVGDASKVHQCYLWKTEPMKFSGLFKFTRTNTLKWFIWLEIYTDKLIEDLNNLTPIADIQAEELRLIRELEDGLSQKIKNAILDNIQKKS